MMMGLGKKFAVTFSFIMGIPAVLGAVILEIPEVVENGLTLPLHIVIIGFVTSLVFGLLAIALVNRLVVSDQVPLLRLLYPHRRRHCGDSGHHRTVLRSCDPAGYHRYAGVTFPVFLTGSPLWDCPPFLFHPWFDSGFVLY